MYTYQCNIIRVIDGNTVDANIDLGFNVTIRQRIKLYGVNVSDIRSADEKVRQQAIASKEKLAELLGNEFVCETLVNKRGKAGRVMGKLTIDSQGSKVDINQQAFNIKAPFIRAPKIISTGDSIDVIAKCNGDIVVVKSGIHYGLTFHPELSDIAFFHNHIFTKKNELMKENNAA